MTTQQETSDPTLKQVAQRAKSNIVEIVVFATLFIVVGQFAPQFYYRYIDTKSYYLIDKVTVPTEVHQCQDVEFHMDRESKILSQSERTVSLLFVNPDGTVDKEYEFVQAGAIEPGKSRVSFLVTIPCSLKPNNYHAHVVTRYEIQGVAKYSEADSNDFTVLPSNF